MNEIIPKRMTHAIISGLIVYLFSLFIYLGVIFIFGFNPLRLLFSLNFLKIIFGITLFLWLSGGIYFLSWAVSCDRIMHSRGRLCYWPYQSAMLLLFFIFVLPAFIAVMKILWPMLKTQDVSGVHWFEQLLSNYRQYHSEIYLTGVALWLLSTLCVVVVPLVLRGSWPRGVKKLYYFSLGGFLFTICCSQLLMNQLHNQVERLKLELASLNIATDVDEFNFANEKHLPVDSKILQLYRDYDKFTQPPSALKDLIFESNFYYNALPDEKNDRRWDEAQKRYINEIYELDKIFSDSSLKLPVNLQHGRFFKDSYTKSDFSDDMINFYALRIDRMLAERNGIEVVRLYNVVCNISDAVGGNVNLSDKYFSYIRRSSVILSGILSSEVLNSAELDEIVLRLQKSESRLHENLKKLFYDLGSSFDQYEYFIYYSFILSREDLPRENNLYRNLIAAPFYAFLMNFYRNELEHYLLLIKKYRDSDFDFEKLPFDLQNYNNSKNSNVLKDYFSSFVNKFSEIILQSQSIKAYLRMSIIGCKIAQYQIIHKSLPKNLESLNLKSMPLDPFNGQAFKYRVGVFEINNPEGIIAGDSIFIRGYQLFGVGSNGIDDNGQYNAERHLDDMFSVGKAIIHPE